MILNGPVPPERQEQSRKNFNIFQMLNGLSYMCLGETMILLFAVQLGCPDTLVATLGAMGYFGNLLLPLGKLTAARVGAARCQSIFWKARNIAAVSVALAAPAMLLSWRNTATALLLCGAFLFYGFRAAGAVMLQPLLGEMTSVRNRSSYIAFTSMLVFGSGSISLIVIALILSFANNLPVLTGIIVAGAFLGVTSSRYISRIDESDVLIKSARKPIAGELKILFGTHEIRKLLAGQFAINLAVIMLIPASVLVLKRGFGYTNTQALLFSLVQWLSAFGISFATGRISRRMGPRRFAMLCYLLLLCVPLLWCAIIGLGLKNALFLALPFVLAGTTYVSLVNAMTHYCLQTVKPSMRISASILTALLSGAGAGLAGMFFCGILLTFSARLSSLTVSFGRYGLYFGMAFALLLPGIFFLYRMKPLPIEKRLKIYPWRFPTDGMSSIFGRSALSHKKLLEGRKG